MTNIKYRGFINTDYAQSCVQNRDYSFVRDQKLGYYFSYEENNFQFHAVDRFASFPLFYIKKNEQLIVSEHINDLLKHLPKKVFDPIGYYSTGEILKGERTEQTPFQGIKRILPGHYIIQEKSQISIICYWSFSQLQKRKFQGTYEEATQTLRKLLKQAIKRCHDFAPDCALHLSGGFDSGNVAALISKESNSVRQAFVYTFKGSNQDNEENEFSFINKYKKHFPQLNINKIFIDKKIHEIEYLIDDAGNWQGFTSNSPESYILRKANEFHVKYILTGLGGDELSSYGSTHQHHWFTVQNDFMTKLYQKEKEIKYHTILFIKNLLRSNKRDNRFVNDIINKTTNHRFWYSQKFINQTTLFFNKPSLGPYFLPSCFKYRLQILDRSYFTVRSDFWNYQGKKYNIDYIHPLLDGDVVDFCTSLPFSFFKNKPTRSLIKSALKDELPDELLLGNKRPWTQKTPYSSDEQVKMCEKIILEYKECIGSFANSVYDIDNIIKTLQYIQQEVDKSTPHDQSTLLAFERFLKYSKNVMHKCTYLNSQFG
jgi:asparagine synthase (glutamine-hydrolysing)